MSEPMTIKLPPQAPPPNNLVYTPSTKSQAVFHSLLREIGVPAAEPDEYGRTPGDGVFICANGEYFGLDEILIAMLRLAKEARDGD